MKNEEDWGVYDPTVATSPAKLNEKFGIDFIARANKDVAFKSIKQGMEEAIQQAGTKCDRNKPVSTNPVNNPVSSPNHYLKLGYECIEIIACSLSQEAFKGYCMGNFLKYRFRMGNKDAMMQDFDKSKEYLMLYDKYMHLCKDVPF